LAVESRGAVATLELEPLLGLPVLRLPLLGRRRDWGQMSIQMRLRWLRLSVSIGCAGVTTAVTGNQLQALPASGRRWQDFVLDTPAAAGEMRRCLCKELERSLRRPRWMGHRHGWLLAVVDLE